ncbi:MAG: hypothetical protein GX824_04630 [Clostridiales bacterium]|jgi:cell division protein FtsB|nr:hypothetical protein [Clostridiales bacterium]
MAGNNNNTAYDFSMFEPRRANPVKEKSKSVSKPKIVPQKSERQLAAEFLRSIPKVAKIFVFSVLCFAVIGSSVFAKAQLTEISYAQNAAQARLERAEAENTRLKMEFSALVSLDKIEEYARNELGMVKCERYQITYLDLAGDDKVVVSKVS